MWHSKWLCYQWMVSIRSLRPQQPGKDKNRAGSMAMWVAPIRVYNHLSREIPFVSKSIDSAHSGNGGLSPTVGDIHSIHSSEMSGRSCVGRVARRSCWTQVYSPLEIHHRKVVPYLVMLEIQSPISAMRFLILYYVCGAWDASVLLFGYLFDVDIIIISLDLISKCFGL